MKTNRPPVFIREASCYTKKFECKKLKDSLSQSFFLVNARFEICKLVFGGVDVELSKVIRWTRFLNVMQGKLNAL